MLKPPLSPSPAVDGDINVGEVDRATSISHVDIARAVGNEGAGSEDGRGVKRVVVPQHEDCGNGKGPGRAEDAQYSLPVQKVFARA